MLLVKPLSLRSFAADALANKYSHSHQESSFSDSSGQSSRFFFQISFSHVYMFIPTYVQFSNKVGSAHEIGGGGGPLAGGGKERGTEERQDGSRAGAWQGQGKTGG